MTHLHIYTGNHTLHGRKTLSELIFIMQHGFAEIGTTVSFSDEFLLTNTQNVLFEYFLPGHKKVLDSIKAEGIIISLFATEIPSRRAFNFRRSGFNKRYTTDWHYRFNAFEECVKNFERIYTNVPLKSAQKYYETFLPTEYFELAGYIESLSKVKNFALNGGPGFYGLKTPYRTRRIQQLDPSLIWPEFMSDDEVDLWLQNRSFVVSLKQHSGWEMQSPTRISRALHAGKYILLEKVKAESPISSSLGSYSMNRYREEFEKLKNDCDYLLEKTSKQLYVHKHEHPAKRYFSEYAKNFVNSGRSEKFFVQFPLP